MGSCTTSHSSLRKSKSKINQRPYRFVSSLYGLNNNGGFGILGERNIIVILDLDVLFIQNTIDLTHIVDKGQLVPELILVRVDDPVCEQVFQNCDV